MASMEYARQPPGEQLELDVAARIQRIDSEDSSADVFTHVFRDQSLETARKLDAVAAEGRRVGALHGVVVALKENVCVDGLSLTLGSRAIRRACRGDAEVVAMLRRAGAVILGLTSMHEIAFGVTGLSSLVRPQNPRSPDRVPGGSSSGSAVAVGTGLADIAIGTDTGGSVRIPAALCGVVGYKPSLGLISMRGVEALAPTLDHVGILGRSVVEVRAAATTLVRPSSRWRQLAEPLHRPIRLGVVAGSDDGLDNRVQTAFRSAIEVAVNGREIAYVDPAPATDVVELSNVIMYFEAFQSFRREFRAHPELFGSDVAARLREGASIRALEYRAAIRTRSVLARRVGDAFRRFDLLVSPTVPIVAPTPAEAGDRAADLVRNTRLYNLLGLPAITIPANQAGPAVGVQLAAAREHDANLLASARIWEALASNPNVGTGGFASA